MKLYFKRLVHIHGQGLCDRTGDEANLAPIVSIYNSDPSRPSAEGWVSRVKSDCGWRCEKVLSRRTDTFVSPDTASRLDLTANLQSQEECGLVVGTGGG